MALTRTFTANALVYRGSSVDGLGGICTEEPSEERFVFNPSTCTYVKRRSGEKWKPVVVVDVRGGMAAAVGARADAMSLMVIALEPDAHHASEEAGRGPVHLQLPVPFCAPIYNGACAIVALVVSRADHQSWSAGGVGDAALAGRAASCATPVTSVGVSQKKLRTLIRNWPHGDVTALFLQYVRYAFPPPLRSSVRQAEGPPTVTSGSRQIVPRTKGGEAIGSRRDRGADAGTTTAAAAAAAANETAGERSKDKNTREESEDDGAADADVDAAVNGEARDAGGGDEDDDEEDEDDNDSEDPTVAGHVAAGIDTDAPVGAVTRDGRKRGAAPARGPSARQAVMRAAIEARFVHADIAVRYVALSGDAVGPSGVDTGSNILRTMLHGVGGSDEVRANQNSDAETVASAAMTEYGATLELGPDGLPRNAPDASDVEVEVDDEDEHSYATSDEDTAADSGDDGDDADEHVLRHDGGKVGSDEDDDGSSAAESPRAMRAARRARGRKFGAALLGGGDTDSDSDTTRDDAELSEVESDDAPASDAYRSADEEEADDGEGEDEHVDEDEDEDEDEGNAITGDEVANEEEEDNVFAVHRSSGRKRARTRTSRL